MLLKDYEPKYYMIELINMSDGFMKLLHVKIAKYKYGDYEIVSVKDFDSTESTSIIIKRARHDRIGNERKN